MPQDAGLGRGAGSPYLNILNHIGLQYDENAPTGFSDEVMCAIGPDSTVRRLEREWSALEAALDAKYGKSTKTTGTNKTREQKRNDLRTAKQRQRREVTEILHKDHFKKRNHEELERQLCGIHGPQQPLQKVVFSLPEQRVLAEILGDLDEDLRENEIVRRKVDAINAWIVYAWKIEPKEPTRPQNPMGLQASAEEIAKQVETPQAALELPIRGCPVTPKPWYTSMIQAPISPPPAVPPYTATAQNPPPPYSEVDKADASNAARTVDNGTGAPPASRQQHARGGMSVSSVGDASRGKGTMWN